MSQASRKAKAQKADARALEIWDAIEGLDRAPAEKVVQDRFGLPPADAELIVACLVARSGKNARDAGSQVNPDSCRQRVLALTPLPKNLRDLDARVREKDLEAESLAWDFHDKRELLSRTIAKANADRQAKTP